MPGRAGFLKIAYPRILDRPVLYILTFDSSRHKFKPIIAAVKFWKIVPMVLSCKKPIGQD